MNGQSHSGTIHCIIWWYNHSHNYDNVTNNDDNRDKRDGRRNFCIAATTHAYFHNSSQWSRSAEEYFHVYYHNRRYEYMPICMLYVYYMNTHIHILSNRICSFIVMLAQFIATSSSMKKSDSSRWWWRWLLDGREKRVTKLLCATI